MSDRPNSYTPIIDNETFSKIKALGLPEVKEKNTWLLLHIKGDGIRAPESWNAKVYTNMSRELKLVTTDAGIFNDLMSGKAVICNDQEHCVDCPPQRFAKCEEDSLIPERTISIDDSGWGFPVGGTLVGIHDSKSGRIAFCEVPVDNYQSPRFERKAYLDVAAKVTIEKLAVQFNILEGSKPGVLFKVCTGYVNTRIVEILRGYGFTVETCAIGEPLQSALEKQHREYIKCMTNADVYYDPKELNKSNIGRAYSKVIEWIQKNNAWDIAKTGWKSMKKLQRG